MRSIDLTGTEEREVFSDGLFTIIVVLFLKQMIGNCIKINGQFAQILTLSRSSRYYNREAVVISALQVEKHPITTPGPLTMSPCAAARMQKGVMGVYSALQLAKGMSGSIHSAHLTPLTGTPHGKP